MVSRPGSELLIVLPCLNERAHLPGVLASLQADPACEGALLVIVDAGSRDGTREFAEAEAAQGRCVLLHNPKRRQGAGVNLAVERYGEGRRWLLRVDVHADYPADYVTQLMKAAAETRATSVVVSMETVGRACFQRAVALAQNSRLGTGGAAHRSSGISGWVDHGHHALMAIDSFMGVQGYDETFVANEDAELDQRLAKAGGRIWLTTDAVVTYYPRSTPAGLFLQYLRYGSGRAQTLFRHRARPKLRQMLPTLVAPSLLILAGLGVSPLAALPAVAWSTACVLYGLGLALAERSACGLMAGPAAMVMHLAWSLGFWRTVLFRSGSGPRSVSTG